MTTAIEKKESATLADVKEWGKFALEAGLVPQGINIYQATAIIQAGKEMGLQPLQALRTMSFVHGRLVMTVQVQLALARERCGITITEPQEQNGSCTITLKRGQEQVTCTYTMDDARKAGLVRAGGSWDKYPKQMLRWRAIGDALRLIAPDFVMGLLSPEEAENIIDMPATVQAKTEAKLPALQEKLEVSPGKEVIELTPEEVERKQVADCKSYVVDGLAFHESSAPHFFQAMEAKIDKPQSAWDSADWERAKVAFTCLVNGKYRLTSGTGGCKLEVVTEEKKQAPKVRKSISEKISALLKELNLMSDAQRLLQDTVGVDSLEKLDTQHASAFFNVLSDAKEGRCNLRRLDNGKWEVEYPPQEGLGNRLEDMPCES